MEPGYGSEGTTPPLKQAGSGHQLLISFRILGENPDSFLRKISLCLDCLLHRQR